MSDSIEWTNNEFLFATGIEYLARRITLDEYQMTRKFIEGKKK